MPCPWRGHFPSSGIGKAIFPAHSPRHGSSPKGSQLYIHNGVRIRPPRRASAGSSGTAVVAKKLARLSQSAVTHSSGDLLSAGWARRLDLWARASQASEWAALAAGMLAFGASGPMSTSSAWVAAWPVTVIKPALSSAFDSVMRSTAGGDWLELAIVWCCIASALLARSVMRLTSSAISKSEVGTQSESASTKFTVQDIGLRGLRHRPKCSGLGPNLCLNWWGCALQLFFLVRAYDFTPALDPRRKNGQ